MPTNEVGRSERSERSEHLPLSEEEIGELERLMAAQPKKKNPHYYVVPRRKLDRILSSLKSRGGGDDRGAAQVPPPIASTAEAPAASEVDWQLADPDERAARDWLLSQTVCDDRQIERHSIIVLSVINRLYLAVLKQEGASEVEEQDKSRHRNLHLPSSPDPVREEMARALESVRSIIVDGAMVGFNPCDGDWAERLYASQAITKAALSLHRGKG